MIRIHAFVRLGSDCLHSVAANARSSATSESARGFLMRPERNFETQDEENAPSDFFASSALVAEHAARRSRSKEIKLWMSMTKNLAL